MKRTLIAALIAAASLTASSAPAAHLGGTAQDRTTARLTALRHIVVANRHVAWRQQDRAHLHRTATAHRERRTRSVLFLRWLVRWWHDRAQAALAQHHAAVAASRMVVAAAAGHAAGWACITNGAYPRAPHEGNGYNGPYSGPLGMTTPWMGHSPPGSDWVHSSAAAVYAIAEQEAAKQGFSDAWMRGQWPNTYPPCARFFQ